MKGRKASGKEESLGNRWEKVKGRYIYRQQVNRKAGLAQGGSD